MKAREHIVDEMAWQKRALLSAESGVGAAYHTGAINGLKNLAERLGMNAVEVEAEANLINAGGKIAR